MHWFDIKMESKSNKGMTILELLITMALLGVIAALALPSLMDGLGRMSAKSATRSFTSALSLARSEAVKSGSNVSICPSDDGLDCKAGSWANGWIVFIDADGDADGDTGSVDAGDTVLRRFEPLAGLTLSVSPATNLIRYDAKGYGLNASALTFSLCPLDGNINNARRIEVSLSGRARTIEGAAAC